MVPPQMHTKKGETTNGRLSEGTSDAWISWSAGEWAVTRRELEVTNIVRYSSSNMLVYLTPKIGKWSDFDAFFFEDGLVQPPTRLDIL